MSAIEDARQNHKLRPLLQAFAGRIENAAELCASSGLTETEDGELLTALLHARGPSALHAVDGAFALVAERPDGGTILARDLLARRPLYWRREGNEIRTTPALETFVGSGQLEPDRAAILEWLLYRQVLPPNTVYHGIHAVPLGACLQLPEVSAVPPSSFPYGLARLISPERMRDLATTSDGALVDELERLLVAALERACVGRSRVGVLLSGGIDSSLVASIAREFAQVTAFTMGTQAGGDLDETEQARSTAARLGIPIETVAVDRAAYARLAPAATRRLCLPLFHAHNVGFNVAYEQLLARAAGLGLDRVMSGDTAGTSFGFEGRAAALGWLLPLRRLLDALPGGSGQALQKLVLDRAGLPITIPEMPPSAPLTLCMVDGGTRSRVMAGALEACAFIPSEHDRMVKAIALSDIVAWLPRFMDRAALLGDRWGIEVTTPFYHRPLLSFGLCLPVRALRRSEGFPRRRRITKWALMQVAQRRLGDLGFFCRRAAWSAPQGRYVAPLATSLLTPDGFCAQHFGLGTADVAKELANRRQDPNSMAKLVHLELWGRTCTMGQDPDELGDRLASAIGKA